MELLLQLIFSIVGIVIGTWLAVSLLKGGKSGDNNFPEAWCKEQQAVTPSAKNEMREIASASDAK